MCYHGGLKGNFAEELGGLKGGARAGPPWLWEVFNTGRAGMEIVSKSAAASGITARTGFLCRQGAPAAPHSEGHLTPTHQRAPEGLSIGPIAELPSKEREGEAPGVRALLQIKLEVFSLLFYN